MWKLHLWRQTAKRAKIAWCCHCNVSVKSKLQHAPPPPGQTPGIWHLCRPGEAGSWLSESSREWGIWSPCFRGGEFELHPRFHVKYLAWRAIMGDAVLVGSISAVSRVRSWSIAWRGDFDGVETPGEILESEGTQRFVRLFVVNDCGWRDFASSRTFSRRFRSR